MIEYKKINDGQFEITIPSTEQWDIGSIKDRIGRFQGEINQLAVHLQEAVAVGCADAQPVLDALKSQPLTTVDTQTLPIS